MIISKRNIADLKLTAEQMQELERQNERALFLKSCLHKANISKNAIDKIIDTTDLNKLNMDAPELVQEQIKNTFSDFIINKER